MKEPMQETKKTESDAASLLHPPGSLADVVIVEPIKRTLVRPNPHYWRTALYVLITVASYFAIYFGAFFIFTALVNHGNLAADFKIVSVSIWIASGCLAVFLFIVRKRIPIWFVHIYQYHAPEDVRMRCVFIPSCSEYMILAIEKYGVIRGIYKGIRRMGRCHSPNGGEDYP